jgi:DNA-binding IscR family transcriptional regulator
VTALEAEEFRRCLDHLKARGRKSRCHVRRVFGRVQRTVAEILDQTTLADMLEVVS